VCADLLDLGGARPVFRSDLAADLRRRMVDATAEMAERLELTAASVWVDKRTLAGVHGCERRFEAGRADGFPGWSPALAKGSVVHRALQLGPFLPAPLAPLDLVDLAISRIVEDGDDRSPAQWLVGATPGDLAELRAERRLTGSVTHLPVMADCERGLGRPQRALELAQSADVRDLDEPGRIEMLIVASGARRDLGQPAAAVVSLQAALGDRADPQPWSARLWYAYADALLAAGRQAEAVEWFAAVAEIDDGDTDAEERLLTLEPNSPGP